MTEHNGGDHPAKRPDKSAVTAENASSPAAPAKRTSGKAALRAKADKVLRLLQRRYPAPQTHLEAEGAWQLLVATMLAAQCTDERVNKVTPALFNRWPGPAEIALADIGEVEEYVRSTGFYRNKARHLVGAAQRLVADFNGEVPATMRELVTLPGVARKTANVVLFGAFGINEGLAVDTHVGRICFRLGLTASRDPVKVERDLTALFPQEEWGNVNHRLVWFGRHVCKAVNPQCGVCEMAGFCEKNGLRPVPSRPKTARK